MRLQALDEPSSSPQRCERRLKVIRNYLRPGGVGAEIGVFKGAFVDYLLSTEPSKLYLVDPWYRLSAEWRWAAGDKSTVNALINILSEFKPELETKRVELRVEFSNEFLAHLPDHSLDWIYLDSSHSYEGTLEELHWAVRKVRPDGYITGDDWNEDPHHRHHGVCRAVREYEAQGLIRLHVAGANAQFVASVRSRD